MQNGQGKAPGKVILIGEHAAVYGYPILLTSVDLYTKCEVTTNGDEVHLLIPQIGLDEKFSWEEVFDYTDQVNAIFQKLGNGQNIYNISDIPRLPSELAMIVLREIVDYFAIDKKDLAGISIQGETDIPIGGFGSSTAGAYAIAQAFVNFLNIESNKKDYFNILYSVESKIYTIESGRFLNVSGADQTTVINEGLVRYQKGQNKKNNYEVMKLSENNILKDYMIINTGRPRNTTGETVGYVKSRYEKNPDKYGKIFKEIGRQTDIVLEAIKTSDSKKMYSAINRAGDLLVDLGVVSKKTQELMSEIRRLNGHTKISGAGTVGGDASGSVLCFGGDKEKIKTLLNSKSINYFKM